MELEEFVSVLIEEFYIQVANWHKRKNGFNHHDAKRLLGRAILNVFLVDYKRRKKLGRPPKEPIFTYNYTTFSCLTPLSYLCNIIRKLLIVIPRPWYFIPEFVLPSVLPVYFPVLSLG